VGAGPAPLSGAAKSAGSGSFSAAARARTAADTAGLERGTGAGAEPAAPLGCAGLPAGAAGKETVPAEPARVLGDGVGARGGPGVGALDPALPPP
jgi:hypothetical protein